MLLRKLVERSERIDATPALYSEVPIRYVIDLDPSGMPLGPPIDTSDPSSPRTKRGQRMLMPNAQRSSGIKPLLLADNAEYTLGVAKPESKPDRVEARHASYVELVRRCVESTQDADIEAIANFLDAHADGLEVPPDFDRGGAITFRVSGRFVADSMAVQAFWAREHEPSDGAGAPVMQCVVCGNERPVLKRLQAKLKRIPGGQSSGTALISANADAFESYGLSASLISPICSDCAERFTKSLNDLLSSETARIVVGPSVFVAWTREDVAFSFRDWLTAPKPEQVRALIHSVRSGRVAPDTESTAFYAVSLSASGGRAVVRDWIDTTVGSVQRNLARWFDLQAIAGHDGGAGEPIGLWALAAATVREARDVSPTVPRDLFRFALAGGPLPSGLLFQAVKRNKAEGRVTRPRAALIKAVLLGTKRDRKEDEMVALDPENHDAAYLCGRLMAVLEGVQRAALPRAKAGIVDRFFGSASTAPASVFGRLIRGAQPHLAKLERDRPGAYVALQQRMGEVIGGIGEFPKTLSLQEQGLFALGYYHQRAHDWAQARQRKELRDIAPEVTAEEMAASTGKES